MTRGDDVTLDVTAVDQGQPVDLTGCDLWWTAKLRKLDADAEAVMQKTNEPGGGITVTDQLGGIAEVAILPADTEDLASIALWWDLQVRDGDDKIRTLASGRLVVNSDVTRAS